MGSVMRPKGWTDLEIRWLSEATPLRIASRDHNELRVKGRSLVLVDLIGNEEIYVRDVELFGAGPPRALVIRRLSHPDTAVLLGEEGSELLRLDFPGSSLPRGNPARPK